MMYLGIDYGKKRIGLAVGSQYPKGIGTLTNPGSFDVILEKIAIICKDYEIEKIVVGLPRRTSGELGEMAAEIEHLAMKLRQRTGVPVEFEEEGYTSLQAEQELKERGVSLREEKEKIDELSAVLILEQHINRREEEERK